MALLSVNLRGFCHHPDDFLIRSMHADPGQPAEIGNGVFNSFDDQAVSRVELLSVPEHFISENPRLHCRCNLGGAGGFGPVAHNAGGNGQGVDDGVGDIPLISAQQIGDSGPGARSCTDRPTVCGQPSDA